MVKNTYRNGSPYDRGSADAYYGREFRPHYFAGKTYQSTEITEHNMYPDQIQEYRMGWEDQKASGIKKNWG